MSYSDCHIHRYRRFPLVGFLILLVSGCGPSTGTVSGKITLNGKPLTRGLITFLPEAGNRNPASAAIIKGAYQTAPFPCGIAKITITAMDSSTESGAPGEVKGGDLAPPPREGGAVSTIPTHYGDANLSKLTLTVVQGENTFDHDIKP